jgi:YVTN family beta-propeller protein
MKKILFTLCIIFILIGTIVYSGCRRDVPSFDLGASKYPEAIANIVMTKCAVSGCHNTQSKDAAAGLDLSSWDKMMEGDRNGAVCVPYSSEYSTMFMFTNTFSDMGAMVMPTMPNNGPPLTREQETTLRNWIDAGAPDANGFVKWSDNPNRKKYYITNQGCDVVCVVDAETNLQMRYIPVGASSDIESPHNLKISPDGQYWACTFSNFGKYLEVHRTSDDAFVTRILLGPTDSAAVGSWNTFSFSPDGHYAWAVDWSPNGRQAWVDLQTNRWRQTYQGSGWTTQPHGSAVTPDGNFLYLTCLAGNYIHKMDISVPQLPSDNQIEIDGLSIGATNNNQECSHDILLSPDGTKAFITCQKSNMIRVVDVATDQLIGSIPVGIYPQEMAISADPSTPYLYVTCMEDTATYPGNRGSISVVNWQTNTFVTSINSGFQPHGITVNDDKHVVLVANRDFSPGGPAPHHATSCAGRNGYFTLIDMQTNTLIPGSKTELVVDPYSAAYRR